MARMARMVADRTTALMAFAPSMLIRAIRAIVVHPAQNRHRPRASA
ncbi:MAG: hypothetical protein AVDCRST_MAG11-572 [uncultured Gemmatimonadaceae bacterium]|uniref:Uncharacterized protein n=1 Tax=uncultured Gemmatimonadaceae bacterium TaxID=246130 RepID=A0A6J4K7K8_9BACT|nr:MAG: hypothetical protein AVDCRST_MAG11-572 [uncultured Gemmatimonadaceae bacterium]